MKLLLIHIAENPRAFKNCSKDNLPVIYKSNKKAWITGSLFSHWLTDFAVPAWKKYCEKENLSFKILLLIDNAPSHPIHLDELDENVKVIFISPNTTALMQPTDQGVIAAFKAYYLRRTFRQLIEATNSGDKSSIVDFWRSYNIFHTI